MTGRKSLSATSHKLTGTYQKCRHEGALSAEAHRGVPPIPEWLSEPAKAVWADLAPMLDQRNTLTPGDATAFALLAEAICEWRELSADVRTEGRTYEVATKSGGIMKRQNPKCGLLSDAHRRVQSMLAEFGLSPAMRSKVSAATDPKKDNKFANLDRSEQVN